MSWTLATYRMTTGDVFASVRQAPLYVVLDAAVLESIVPRMEEMGDRAAPLFGVDRSPRLSVVAPYVARVDLPLMEWIHFHVWQRPWGILIESAWALPELREHLAHFLVQDAPDGKALYSRYYDPRVLTKLLPTYDSDALAALYGEAIDAFIAVGEKPDQFARYALEWASGAARRRPA